MSLEGILTPNVAPVEVEVAEEVVSFASPSPPRILYFFNVFLYELPPPPAPSSLLFL